MTAPTTGRFDLLRVALLDRSTCPACGAPLTGPRCTWCGVPLDGPAADAVLRLSLEAAEALARREAGLRGLYAERDARRGLSATDRGRVPARAAAPARAVPTTRGGGARPMPGRYPAAAAGGALRVHPVRPAPSQRPPVREVRAHWRVQSVLQALGAGLLSAAGIVFLVFSWGDLDLQVRAAVIASGTVVVFLLAHVLARRGLRQGAEAVGAVAAVLLVLDAWALRRTGAVGIGEPGVYASAAAASCALLLGWWGRAARLRVGTVAGAVLWLATPIPLATLEPSTWTVAWALLATVATSWVRHTGLFRGAAAQDPVWRTGSAVLSVGGALAWPVAVSVALASLGSAPGDGVALMAAAAAFAAMQSLLSRTVPVPADRQLADHWHLAAVTVALVAVLGTAALGAPAVLTGLCLVAGGCATVLVAVAPAAGPAPTAPPRGHPGERLGRVLAADPSIALGPAGALLTVVGAGALASGGRTTVTGLLLLAGAASFLDRQARTGSATGAAAARITVAAAPLVAVVAARRSVLATALALAACAAVAVRGRAWGPGRAWCARSTAVAAPWGTAAIGVLAHAAGASAADAMMITSAAAAAVLALVVVAPDRPRPERQVALAIAASTAATGWLLAAAIPGWWGPSVLLVVAAACLVVVLALVAGAERVGALAAVLGAGAGAPVLALALASGSAVPRYPITGAGVILLATSAGGTAVLLAVVARDRRGQRAGLAAAVGGWATLAGSLLAAPGSSSELTAVVLLTTAVVALVAGFRDDAEWLRWSALALGTAASWILLATDHPGISPEAFTAPTAIVVAAVGAVRLRRGSDGLALLTAGLSLVLLPTALLAGSLALPADVHADRRVLTGAAAAALAVLAARRPSRGADGVTTVLGGLALALAVLGPLRAALQLAPGSGAGALPDGLGILAAVLLLVACRSLGTAAPLSLSTPVRTAEPWAVTIAAVLPSLLTAAPGPAGLLRLAVVGLLGVGAMLTGAVAPADRRRPWRRHLMGLGILLATAAALVAARTVPGAPGGVAAGTLGLLLVATLLLRPPMWSAPADVTRAAVAVLLLAGIVLWRSEPWRPWLWLGVAVVLLTGAWLARSRPGATSAARVVGWTGGGIAIAGPWLHVLPPLTAATGAAHGVPERWALPAAALLAAASVLGWPRRAGLPGVLTLVAPAAGAAEAPSLLAAQATPSGVLRLSSVFAAGAALACVAQEQRISEPVPARAADARVAHLAGMAIAASAALAMSVVLPWPADVPIAAFGLLLTLVGLRLATTDRTVRSWSAIGPGLVCALVVPALVSGADTAMWRPVVVVVLAAVATVAGAAGRWQAPFVLGGGSLVLVTVLQLGPWAGHLLVQTQGWVLLALCGTVLLALGLRYERRLAQAREAVRFVATMR